jgi:hypothetical protein
MLMVTPVITVANTKDDRPGFCRLGKDDEKAAAAPSGHPSGRQDKDLSNTLRR